MSTDLSRTLVTGGDGMVGSYIDFGIKTNRNSLDVTDRESVRAAFAFHRPQAIIHLAAETSVETCTREPARAYLVNAVGTYYVAQAAAEAGIRLIYVSTNAVFPGKKSGVYTTEDVPSPADTYGHSKYLGELAVRGLCTDYCIVRTSSVFGGGKQKDKKFVGKILSQRNEATIQAAEDAISVPTFGKDLVASLRDLLMRKEQGTFHAVNGSPCSRFACAEMIAHLMHFTGKVVPVPSSVFGGSGSNVALASSLSLRPWQEALEEYLANEWSSS